MPSTRTLAVVALLLAAVISAEFAGCSTLGAARPETTPAITATHSGAAAADNTSTCSAASMTATLGQGPEVVAAGVGTSIMLTNNAATPCALRGYVSLSYLSSSAGPVIGSPTRQDDSGTFSSQPVVIRPGGSAMIVFSDVQNHDSSCHAQPLWGYRVLLPGDDRPITVSVFGTGTDVSDPSLTICPDSYMVLAPVQDPGRL